MTDVEQSAASPLDVRASPRDRLALLIVWLAFWLLMFGVGVQEYFRSGKRDLWSPFVDYATAALAASAVMAWHLRKARSLDPLLSHPMRWFGALWIWLPLIAPGFVVGMMGLRGAVHALAGEPFHHDPWGEVMLYETLKFAIFYMLFSGVHFGVRSYRAWHAERLRAERQARLAREAQLAQLTQQLQPHFLFNALNTISSLIHADPDLADELLTRLATLLRAATDAGRRPEHTLADELTLLEAYAAIMTERFSDRARVDWAIDPAARECRVPTLGLQPLLENCFRHVVERRRAPTRIVVRARLDSGRVIVEVEDDGEGGAALPTVGAAAGSTGGVGLANLRGRLDALHGDQAGLTLLAAPTGGLIARVELPCAC